MTASLPTYAIGDEGKPDHFVASTSRENAAEQAKSLAVGDSAFIKRSDLKWTYAIVTERMENEGSGTTLRFEVDTDKNRKSFPEAQWGKYIRVITASEEELARLRELAGESAAEEPAAAAEEMPEVTSAVSTDGKSTGGTSASSAKSSGSSKGWLTSIFGSAKKEKPAAEETKIVESVPEEAKAEEAAEEAKAEEVAEEKPESAPVEEKPATPTPMDDATPEIVKDDSVETPIEQHVAEPMKEDPAAAALAATSFPEQAKEEVASSAAPMTIVTEPDNTKENSDPDTIKLTHPRTFLPSPKVVEQVQKEKEAADKDTVSSLRTPLNLRPTLSLKKKGSLVNKMFKKKDKSTPKAVEEKTPVDVQKPTVDFSSGMPSIKSPKVADGKEWFDPEACEVDYDKNPTDLFQALEARQFSYADEMCKQVHIQFTKECRTWVVARGQKKKDTALLRFRALPLHAALVFGAPDDMIKKILNAYPKATRGRDVKGRLPIHLAMEHNASEEVMCMVLEAFPKGFFARDKRDMLPLDYVNGNMARVHMKRYLPLLMAARVEDEKAKWDVELESALAAQKLALKTDPVYMEDVIATITDDVENTYASKMELLEANYKKEIQLLKTKHDSETQALLEGFEVKLNFERKLQKLKGTKA
ncbi:hypothetical protein ACHAXR_007832 [Thalassiosira sp. AJA248-18]